MRKWVLVAACAAWNSLGCAQEGCPPFFRGFYIGGNAGFASYTTERYDEESFFLSNTNAIENDTSWAAGVQIGYDWSCNHALVGLIADWDWTNARTKYYVRDLGSIDARMRWLTTIRARGGVMLSDVLFYVTGGAAVADLKTDITNTLYSPSSFSFHKCRWGYTAGFGAEFALCGSWSVSAELLYMGFRRYPESISAIPPIPFPKRVFEYSFKFFDEAWTGRIGLNYRFSLCSFW